MFLNKFGDLIVGVFFLLLSLLLIALGIALPPSKVMEIGPDFMPIVVGVITAVLSVALILTSIPKIRKFDPAAVVPSDEEEVEDPDYVKVVSSLVLILLYIVAFRPVGFILSTFVYLPFQIFVMAPTSKRKPVQFVLISLIVTLAVFFLFRYGFKIVLPQGIFTINL